MNTFAKSTTRELPEGVLAVINKIVGEEIVEAYEKIGEAMVILARLLNTGHYAGAYEAAIDVTDMAHFLERALQARVLAERGVASPVPEPPESRKEPI